jgi:transcriptional regulator with XRE-family HTH domain
MLNMAKKRRLKFSDQLRRAIETSELSRYEISKRTGIAQSTLSKFMAGKGGLSVEGLDKIADCLGLNLTSDPAAKKGT